MKVSKNMMSVMAVAALLVTVSMPFAAEAKHHGKKHHSQAHKAKKAKKAKKAQEEAPATEAAPAAAPATEAPAQ